uniref:Uncharacterized protein n=1 Tax=Arundo donax TaxID=35708 RepID=A0A0A9BMJ6_ARUDO
MSAVQATSRRKQRAAASSGRERSAA